MFYYNDMTPIKIGDNVKLVNSNLIGVIAYIKGSMCIKFNDPNIEPILFYNIYIHTIDEMDVIKAIIKIN